MKNISKEDWKKLILDTKTEVMKLYKFCNIKSNDIDKDIKIIDTKVINKYKFFKSEYDRSLLENLPM